MTSRKTGSIIFKFRPRPGEDRPRCIRCGKLINDGEQARKETHEHKHYENGFPRRETQIMWFHADGCRDRMEE